MFFDFGHGNSPNPNPPSSLNQCYITSDAVKMWKVRCHASASSVYPHGYFNEQGRFDFYSPHLAVDGLLAPGNTGFFHSNIQPYPWLKIEFRQPEKFPGSAGPLPAFEPINLHRVEIYQRCDANELYHQTTYEIRYETQKDIDIGNGVVPLPRLHGGKICATTNQVFFTGG